MKVRIEFESDGSGGLESMFDAVEFQSSRASDVEGWSDAVTTFIRSSPMKSKTILLTTLFDDCSKLSGKSSFVIKNLELLADLRDELSELIDEANAYTAAKAVQDASA